MSQSIKTSEEGLRQLLGSLKPMINEIDSFKDEISKIESYISSRVMDKACVEADLSNLRRLVSTSSEYYSNNYKGVEQCITEFNNTDMALANAMRGVGYLAAGVAAGPMGIAAYDLISQMINAGTLSINDVFGLKNILDNCYVDTEKLVKLLEFKNKKETGKEDDGGLFILGAGVAGSIALLKMQDGLKGKYGEIGGSVSLFKAEAEAKGGLYYEDGHLVIGAEASASVCAIEAEGFISTPSDGLAQLSLKGKVKALEAKAEASAKLSLKEGGVKAEVGATLASVEGTLGGRLGPVEASVTGELKVGIGAEADIGWKNGKLHCKLGASVGIGASIEFELGLSEEAVKTVTDFAASTINNIGNTVNSISNLIGNSRTLLSGMNNFKLPFL